MAEVYDCDRCGACCHHLIVEATHQDAAREVRITREGLLMDGHGEIPFESATWALNTHRGLGEFPCVFLGSDKLCGIYPTRPEQCVLTPAGGTQCQRARELAGLDPLAPRSATEQDRIEVLLLKLDAQAWREVEDLCFGDEGEVARG